MTKENEPTIRFNNINVGGIDDNGGVFIGENSQSLWSAHAKSNSGLGTTNGRNIIYQPIDFVIDIDFSDHPINQQK